MADYEILDHTADIGVIVRAGDLKSLFIKAAEAMFDVALEKPLPMKAAAIKKARLRLRAKNIEELMVRWLGELLSLSDCEDVVFTDFTVNQLTAQDLNAVIGGRPRKDFKFKMEIKAVTYHDLKITGQDGDYRCQVIFDV
ncbi:MAG TPA: archease [Candidatus Omnitrophota bacterium]|nr:archease [Candidatus Omnitrophota bacterium]HPD85648.1 archease [Candidatus Omnitrophota bacterium]HRZ04491.1 archease [Candidatus Omnitrophota bacterium]